MASRPISPMRKRIVVRAVLLLGAVAAAGTAPAADVVPEALLPAECVLYVRWDGFDIHYEAFAKTELGKIFNSELQPLVKFLTKKALDALGPGLQSEKLLQGASPAELAEMQNAVKQLPDLLVYLRAHGLVVSADLIGAAPFKWQVTIVIPEGGNEKTANAATGLLKLLAKQAGAKPTTETVAGRKALVFADAHARADEQVNVAAWAEGAHFMVTVGSEKLESTLARLDDKAQPTLAGSEVFKKTSGFSRYTTYARGFVDTERVFKKLSRELPPVAPILEQLGAAGLKRFSFFLGFEGPHQRSTLEAIMPKEERKGALGIFGALQPVSAESLPPLPPDASFVSTVGVPPDKAYDYAVELASVIFNVATGEDPKGLRAKIDELEKDLGIKFREDLLASIESPIVLASAPSEGPFLIGTTLAIKVKDAKKLSETLETLRKSLGSFLGTEIGVTKRQYNGAELNMLNFQGGFFLNPTYTIHEGWLMIALYPQPIQGFAFRAKPDISRWQPTSLLAECIEAERKHRGDREVRIVGFAESDPRPTVNSLLGIAPLMVKAINTGFGRRGGKSTFDASIIPNAQAITERIKPGVTLVVDDGDSIRVETYATLPLGFQFTGMDMYFLFALPGFFLGF